MSINILIRKESQDEQKALGATHLDDIDLVPSERDGRPSAYWTSAEILNSLRGKVVSNTSP